MKLSARREANGDGSGSSRWRNTLAYYGLYICLGLSTAIAGPTLPDLARQTGSKLGDMGSLFLIGPIGYTLGTFLGGRLYDRIRGHALAGGAQLAAAACIAAIPLAPQLWIMLAIVFLRGLAEGFINTGGNTLLLWTHGEKVSPFMNGLHFFFGVGAFTAPFVVAQLTAVPGGYRLAYWTVAAVAAFAGLCLFAMGGSPRPQTGGNDPAATDVRTGPGRRHYGLIAIAAVFLFFYVGAEISFGNW